MGLDCYWVKPNESKSKPLDFDPPVCFEDEHDHEDRRKGWAKFVAARDCKHAIEEITGVSLYAQLKSETVLKMADRLEAFAAKPWPLPPSQHRRGHHAYDAEMYRDIARMFRAYGEAGYNLSGDW